MSSVARVKFIKTKVIFRYHTKVSQIKFHHIRIIHVQSYSCSNSSTKVGKNEKVGKIFWITKRGNEGITNWGRFRDYKSGQEGLQIGAALGISNRGKEITNRGRNFKSGQRDFESGQEGFQIGAGITNRCRTSSIAFFWLSFHVI